MSKKFLQKYFSMGMVGECQPSQTSNSSDYVQTDTGEYIPMSQAYKLPQNGKMVWVKI